MQARVCGREQEYGMAIYPEKEGKDFLNHEYLRNLLISEVIDSIHQIAPGAVESVSYTGFIPSGPMVIWLKNGAKFYNDNKVFESATAECLAGSLDLIAQERALEIILAQAAQLLARTKRRKFVKIDFYKNNFGLSSFYRYQKIIPRRSLSETIADLRTCEVSYGSHQNYSYEESKKNYVYFTLLNFIPASLFLTGNGHLVRVSSRKYRYCFSQRAFHVGEFFSMSHHDSKPLISLRDRSYVLDSPELNRLHLTSRDATRCEFQTWLVDEVTHLVLRLAEEGWQLPKEFSLVNILNQMHLFNASGEANYPLRTLSGSVGALDYNRLFLNAAKQLSPLSPEEAMGLAEWERVLDVLRLGEVKKLAGELDWATKLELLKKKMRKHGFGLEDPRARRIAWDYHNISGNPKRSWFAWLDERGLIRHLIGKEAVQKAMVSAPETRAKSRGEFIDLLIKNPGIFQSLEISWEAAYAFYRGKEWEFIFGQSGNPACPSREGIDKFIAILKLRKSRAKKKLIKTKSHS